MAYAGYLRDEVAIHGSATTEENLYDRLVQGSLGQ
jgi:hypothetical protein